MQGEDFHCTPLVKPLTSIRVEPRGRPLHRKRTQSGMSYVELMLVNFLMVSLLVYSMQNFSTWVERTRIASIANHFRESINLARLQASRRNSCATVCRAEAYGDGMACIKGNQWQQGWIVLVNKACMKAENLPRPLPRNLILHVSQALPDGYSLNTTAKTLMPWYLTFDARATNNSPWLGAHYELMPPSRRARLALDLCVNLLGHMRVQPYRGYCDS